MYTMSKFENKAPGKRASFAPLLALFFAMALITSAVKFALNFRQLYYFDLNFLKIPQESGVGRDEIVKNYDTLIDYLKTSFTGELKFPTFPMSPQAKQHFVEVKNIFVALDYIMYASIIISFIGIVVYLIKKNNRFLKWTSIYLLLLPLLLAVPFAVNFDATFTVFHKIFFSNNYWQFDPAKDPIINVLPEAFFMHTAIVILAILVVESIILYWIYRKTRGRETRIYNY